MLGSQFLKSLSGSEDFEMYAFDKDDFDISNRNDLKSVFKRISPDFVINCAAYTDVDGCESNKKLAFKINGDAPGEIARVCKEENAVLVHFSTDYVFDGSSEQGYAEDDATSPINIYGESKLKAEELIAQNMDEYYIIRTSWLFGENGKNFVDTMVNLGKTKEKLDVVDDQIGSPTYTKDLCHAVIKHFLMPFLSGIPRQHHRSYSNDDNSPNKLPFGVYHLTNSKHTSWFGFTKKIFEIMNFGTDVTPVKSDKFPRPADRPHCSILNNTKFDNDVRSWEDALRAYLELNFL